MMPRLAPQVGQALVFLCLLFPLFAQNPSQKNITDLAESQAKAESCTAATGQTIVVEEDSVIDFSGETPVYRGDPDLEPYFVSITEGQDPAQWQARFDLEGNSLTIASNTTLSIQGRAVEGGISVPGLSIINANVLTLAGTIQLQAQDADSGDLNLHAYSTMHLHGLLESTVTGGWGRTGNITVTSDCDRIHLAPEALIHLKGSQIGGGDLNLTAHKGNIHLQGRILAETDWGRCPNVNLSAPEGAVFIESADPTTRIRIRNHGGTDAGKLTITAREHITLSGQPPESLPQTDHITLDLDTPMRDSEVVPIQMTLTNVPEGVRVTLDGTNTTRHRAAFFNVENEALANGITLSGDASGLLSAANGIDGISDYWMAPPGGWDLGLALHDDGQGSSFTLVRPGLTWDRLYSTQAEGWLCGVILEPAQVGAIRGKNANLIRMGKRQSQSEPMLSVSSKQGGAGKIILTSTDGNVTVTDAGLETSSSGGGSLQIEAGQDLILQSGDISLSGTNDDYCGLPAMELIAARDLYLGAGVHIRPNAGEEARTDLAVRAGRHFTLDGTVIAPHPASHMHLIAGGNLSLGSEARILSGNQIRLSACGQPQINGQVTPTPILDDQCTAENAAPFVPRPVFTSTPLSTVQSGTTYSYQPVIQAPEGQSVTLTLAHGPSGMTLTQDQRLTWTPAANEQGEFHILLSAGTPCATSLQAFTLEVHSQNSAPQITTTPLTHAFSGTTYHYQAEAQDPDNDPLTWRLTHAPSMMSIDAQSGLIQWLPPQEPMDDHGHHQLRKAGADVLILSTTLIQNNPAELRQLQALGLTWDLVTPTEWLSLTTADFAGYCAVIMGDPDSGDRTILDVPTQTQDIWGPAITGNVMILGSDPANHFSADEVARAALQFVTDEPGKTGFYLVLSEYYDSVPERTPVPILDAFSPGEFTVRGVRCSSDIKIIADHPALDGLTNAMLSDWNCSVHEAFDSWPRDFAVLAMAVDQGDAYTSPTGIIGTPYILARADKLRVVSDIKLFPHRSAAAVNTPSTLRTGLIQGFRPRPNTPVTLTVVEGPNQGLTLSAQTDAQGLASMTYTSPIAGTDILIARFVDEEDRTQTSDYVHLTWTTPWTTDVALTVEDGQGGSDSQSYSIQVSPQDHPTPSLSGTPPETAPIAKVWTYQPQADTNVQWQLIQAPDGMTVDPVTGALAWTPVREQFGPTVVCIQGSTGYDDTQWFVVDVRFEGNLPPTILSNPSLIAGRNQPYSYQMNAFDPEAGPVTYTLSMGAEGATLTHFGRLDWIPSAVGLYDFRITVTDEFDDTTEQTWTVEVVENRDPLITSTPSLDARIGHLWTYTLEAVDPDNDPVTPHLVDVPAGMVLQGNVVSWLPGEADEGDHTITLSVTDARGGIASQTFTLSARPNQNPVFTRLPGTEARAGVPYHDHVRATDPEGDDLTYRVESELTLGIDPETGDINWTPRSSTSGDFLVTLIAEDPYDGRVTAEIQIHVRPNRIPTFTSSPLTTATPETLYQYQATATDPDGDPVSFTLNTAPVGMTLSQSGLVTWTPTPTQIGSHPVRLEVHDGSIFSNLQSFRVDVTAPNQPPVFTNAPPNVTDEGVPYSVQLEAHDPDQDPLFFTLQSGPAGMTLTPDGLLTWHPSPASAGAYELHLDVSDGRGGRDTLNFMLTVHDTQPPINAIGNTAPTIISSPVLTVEAGRPYHYRVAVEDPEGFPIFYSLLESPETMTVDRFRGDLEWTPALADVGSHTVRVEVADAHDATDHQTYTLQVIDPGDITPPRVFLNLLNSNGLAQLGDEIQLQISAVDEVGVTQMTLEVSGEPVQLNGAQGVWTATTPGLHMAHAKVYDAAGNSAEHMQRIFVDDPALNAEPVVEIHSPVMDDMVTAPLTVTATVQTPELAEWVLEIVGVDRECAVLEIARGTNQVTNAIIGELDPTLLPNGLYQLQLTAYSTDGIGLTALTTVVLDGAMKVGRFTLETVDLEIPLRGIPAQLTRGYDSFDKCAGDFGIGWNQLGPRIQASVHPGRYWDLDEQFFCVTTEGAIYPPYDACDGQELPYYCIDDRLDHYFTVTMPDGAAEIFDMTLDTVGTDQLCSEIHFPDAAEVILTPRPGTTSTLEIENSGAVFFRLVETDEGDSEYRLVDTDFQPWTPTRYRLTTAEGVIFTIHGETGLESITDREGNTVTYSRDAIRHSSGEQIMLTRDTEGRITSATDPEGGVIRYAYDEAGDLVAVTDRRGNTIRYTYNDGHNLIDVIDPKGNVPVRSFYDEDGRLIAQEDANGQRISYDHDIAGRQEIIIDRRGNRTVAVYDDRGNVLSSTDALGHTTRYTYDEHDHETSVTIAYGTPLEATTNRTFDDRGNVLTETDPLGLTTTTSYDARHNPLSFRDDLGRGFEFSYDDRDQPTLLVDGAGNLTRFTHNQDSGGTLHTITTDPLGVITENRTGVRGVFWEKDAVGTETDIQHNRRGDIVRSERRRMESDGTVTAVVTTFDFDAAGNLIRETGPSEGITAYEYDAMNRQTARVNPRGFRTETIYDGQGRAIRMRYADGSTVVTTYDVMGNVRTRTDRAGRMTRYTYDENQRLIATQYPDGTVTSSRYDAVGNEVATVDQRGYETLYRYDLAGRLVAIIDPLGNETSYQLDDAGNVITLTSANGVRVENEYDLRGLLTRVRYPDGTEELHVYDAAGRRMLYRNQAGVDTQFQYDGAGNLTGVIDALGRETSFGLDGNWNKISQTDAAGRVTRWSYDADDRLVSRMLPLGQTESFTYDLNGNQITHTDFNGDTIHFEYDADDRLVAKRYPDGTTATFTYTLTGQRDGETDARGTTHYHYDVMDRLIRIEYPNGSWIAYAYDAAGNRTRMETQHQVVTYQFDALNRMVAVTDTQNRTWRYDYDAVGNEVRLEHPDGSVTERVYDELNRLTAIAHRDADGQVFSSRTYELGPTGNRLAVTHEDGRRVDYVLDDVSQLVEERVTDPIRGDSLTSYRYGPTGNRQEMTRNGVMTSYRYDANDRLLDIMGLETRVYRYDDNGSLIEETRGSEARTYHYNWDQRLAEVVTPNMTAQYQYDQDGIRQSKTVNGFLTPFLVDPTSQYAQVVESGGIQHVYGNDLLATDGEAGFMLQYQDALSSVIAYGLPDTGVSPAFYDGYGSRLGDEAGASNPFGFTGEYTDSETGFMYLRARYYDPESGRFNRLDPFPGINNVPLSLHRYLYVHNNPNDLIDPTGLTNLIELVTSEDIKNLMQETSVQNFRVVVKRGGCFFIESILQNEVEKLIMEYAIGTGGAYLLIDAINGGKSYVGQSGDLARRIKEHINGIAKTDKNIRAKFHFSPRTKKQTREIFEQLVLDKLGGTERASNKNNPVSKRKKKKYKRYKNSKLCK